MSGIACAVMAWALVGADAPEAPAAKATFQVRIVGPGGKLPLVGRLASDVGVKKVEAEQVAYEVRVVTTPAAEWREAYYRHCTRVGREGRSTVWTIDEKTAAAMVDGQFGSLATEVVAAPKVTAVAGEPATVRTTKPRFYVADIDRVADGPVDHAGAIAFQPSVEKVDEGFTLSVSGRRTAAGVRAHVKAESTWVGHVARATTGETIANKAFGKTSIQAPMELPQVVEAKLDGDYEVPAGKQLLASLGTATTVDARGRTVVMERLMLLGARPILKEAEESRTGRKSVDPAVRAASVDVTVVDAMRQAVHEAIQSKAEPRRMPPLPSRSPMLPVGPDGKVVELPPLPDEFVTEAEATSTPQPSPQARTGRRGAGFDPELAPARGDAAPPAPIRLDARELASGRTQTFHIPLGAGLAIEVQARVVAGERPE